MKSKSQGEKNYKNKLQIEGEKYLDIKTEIKIKLHIKFKSEF